MPTARQLHYQVKELSHRYVFFTGKEIRFLHKILEDDEKVIALTSGMLDRVTWLAVCTPKRLIFLHRGMILGMRQVQFPLDRIQSIDHQFKILFGSIRVWDGASDFTLGWVLRASITPFVRTTEQAIEAVRHKQDKRPESPAPAPLDIASQLEKLANLKEKGHLTEKEFRRQKKKLLAE